MAAINTNGIANPNGNLSAAGGRCGNGGSVFGGLSANPSAAGSNGGSGPDGQVIHIQV